MPKIDWTDESAVRDTFVEAVYADNAALATRAGTLLTSKSFEGEFEILNDVASGLLLTEDLIPPDPDSAPHGSPGIELLEGFLPAQRFAAIEGGDPLQPAESELWRRICAETLLTDWTELDWDIYSVWAVRRVPHTDGREAYLVDTGGGYSFTAPWNEYIGSAVTIEDGLALLKLEGYISVEDFRERSSHRRTVALVETSKKKKTASKAKFRSK